MYKELKDIINIEKFYEYKQTIELDNYSTINSTYRSGYNYSKGKSFIYKSSNAKAFQEEIQWKIDSIPDDIIEQVYCYEMNLSLMTEWFTKDKKLKRLDIDNFIKSINDAICTKFGIDDKKCFKQKIEKIFSEEEIEKGKLHLCIEIFFYKKEN